jgi:argininosuccinate lyase
MDGPQPVEKGKSFSWTPRAIHVPHVLLRQVRRLPMKIQKQEEYAGYRVGGIRLTQDEDQRMQSGLSLTYESNMLYAYHMFDKAHLVMMAEENMIPRKDAAVLLKTLRAMETEGIEKIREKMGYKHSGEQYLIRELGEEVGGKIHLARSSGDLEEAAKRIRMRDDLLQVMRGINKLEGALHETARKHVDTVMPGYTHGQHAQPTTLAHYLVAYATALQRDFDRLEGTYHRVNASPAGGAIMTGSNFPVNRHRVAELLGFEAPLRNTLDAILGQDTTLEVFSNIALLHNDMARWAIDFQLWCSNEFNMISIPDRFCGTSSIMMQKKNPRIFENIKGASAHTVGGLMSMFLVWKAPTGLPISDRLYALNALSAAFGYVLRDLNLMAEMLPEMKVNTELMRERAGSFWAQATDVGASLVRDKGLPWRTAHQIVGILVRMSYERGIKPCDVDTKLLDEAAKEYMGAPVGLSEESLRKALDPVEFVRGRTLYGGPAPTEVLAQIDELTEKSKQNRDTINQMSDHLKKASERLEKAIDGILTS